MIESRHEHPNQIRHRRLACIIADDFTFANIARCAQGLADYLRIQGTGGSGLVLGYDTRFASREFADTVASVMAGNVITFTCAASRCQPRL